MDTTYAAVRQGSMECGGKLCPPSLDDVLFSAPSFADLSSFTGALVYTIRSKEVDGALLFVAAHLDRSKFIPNGPEKILFRAYRDRLSIIYDRPFLPNEPVWVHDSKDYPPGDALMTAKSWFNQDRSNNLAILVEEKYIGSILVAARTIQIHMLAKSEGLRQTVAV
jgi:hypothetical protein